MPGVACAELSGDAASTAKNGVEHARKRGACMTSAAAMRRAEIPRRAPPDRRAPWLFANEIAAQPCIVFAKIESPNS
jgi:hypothetical protein